MSFPRVVSWGPKVPVSSGWLQSRVCSPSLKNGQDSGCLLCVVPASLSSTLLRGAWSFCRRQLIPFTSPPHPFPPSPHSCHCLNTFCIHKSLRQEDPLLPVPRRRSSSLWQQGVPHTPAGASTSLGDSEARVRRRPKTAGMCWGLQETLGCGKPQVTLLQGRAAALDNNHLCQSHRPRMSARWGP